MMQDFIDGRALPEGTFVCIVVSSILAEINGRIPCFLELIFRNVVRWSSDEERGCVVSPTFIGFNGP